MTAHVNKVNSIDTREFWKTALENMPAIEAGSKKAGIRHNLIGSKHYGDFVELRDFVLSEFGRLDIIGRFDSSRITVRSAGYTAMGVYLYNQAMAVVDHRAQDLARVNTYPVLNEETGETVRIAYRTFSHESQSNDTDSDGGTTLLGDVSSDWSADCLDWGCLNQETSDSASSLDSILALLDNEERLVATTVAQYGSRAEAVTRLNAGLAAAHGLENDTEYTTSKVSAILASAAKQIRNASMT
jgi:hypothetical protein